MNFNQLAIFHAVGEERSVSRGAERLCISQPAASKQILELERNLGTPLFERLPQGMRLTEAGSLLATYSQRIFALEREAEEAVSELRGLERGRIIVGASLTIGVYLLPEVLGAFHRRYPKIQIEMEIMNSGLVQSRLADGTLNIGLIEGFLESGDLTADMIGWDEIVAVAEPSHPILAERPITLEQLCGEPVIMREVGSGTRSVVERALAEYGIAVDPIMSIGSTEAIKRAVTAGIGVAFVSRLAIDYEMAAGHLAIVPLHGFHLQRTLSHLKRRGHRESKAAGAFLKYLRHALFTRGLTSRVDESIMDGKKPSASADSRLETLR